MERVEVEQFGGGGNGAVVRMPGRRFPGVVVQGDSLFVLREEVAEIRAACARGDLDEATDCAGFLPADLDEMLTAYEAELSRHGLPLPYPARRPAADG